MGKRLQELGWAFKLREALRCFPKEGDIRLRKVELEKVAVRSRHHHLKTSLSPTDPFPAQAVHTRAL